MDDIRAVVEGVEKKKIKGFEEGGGRNGCWKGKLCKM